MKVKTPHMGIKRTLWTLFAWFKKQCHSKMFPRNSSASSLRMGGEGEGSSAHIKHILFSWWVSPISSIFCLFVFCCREPPGSFFGSKQHQKSVGSGKRFIQFQNSSTRPVRIRHSSHGVGWQSSHSVDLAGWQAKMASIEIRIQWRYAHKPPSSAAGFFLLLTFVQTCTGDKQWWCYMHFFANTWRKVPAVLQI